MKLCLVVFLLTQLVGGVFSQEAEQEQGERGLLFGLLSSLLFPIYPKTSPPTPRPTLRPTPNPYVAPLPTPSPYVPAVPPPAPAPSPQAIADHMKLVGAKIRATITSNEEIAATFLRLGFHDCVPNGAAGGCDGCVNLKNEANNGLLPAVQTLAPIVAQFENKVLGVSRADIWAYATLLGAEVSQTEIVFTDSFLVGRKNCETVGTCSSKDPIFCASNGPDQLSDFPDSDLTTHQLLAFMLDHFGFNADETVAIMGAHSIGRALPENTGYQGQEGWDNDHKKLDNEYYKALVGPPGALFDGPDWFPIQVVASKEWQWVPAGKGDPQVGTLGFPTYLFGGLFGSGKFALAPYLLDPLNKGWQWSGNGEVPPFMLNADIAIVRDLGIGNKLEAEGRPLCAFRFPEQKKCPAAETLTKAGVYRENNSVWLADFKRVLLIMLKKGMK